MHDISKIDQLFSILDINDDLKMKVYVRIAAIIHLGNIVFEEEEETSLCQITVSTRIHLNYAAWLLKINEKCLESSLLTRKLTVNGVNYE